MKNEDKVGFRFDDCDSDDMVSGVIRIAYICFRAEEALEPPLLVASRFNAIADRLKWP